MGTQQLEKAMEGLVVLIADSNLYTRRLTRMMLTNLGVKATYEAGDGASALDAIRAVNPDAMIMDWDMPVLDGPEVMRIVRSPGVYPKADLPIIMLSDNGLQSRVTTALQLGVHEFLVKPISPKTLQQRLLGLILNPRPMVRAGKFYIPTPRRRGEVKELVELLDAPGEPEQTSAELALPDHLSRRPGQLKDVHPGVGAVDDVNIAAIVRV
jgi:CheY-like chemotaxis protein